MFVTVPPNPEYTRGTFGGINEVPRLKVGVSVADSRTKLSALSIKNAAPGKHFDERGLYLHVLPSLRRYWRFKFRFNRKEQLLSLGPYPEVSLAQARELRDEARSKLRAGINPCEEKRDVKHAGVAAGEHSFETIAREFLGKQRVRLAGTTFEKAVTMLDNNVFPWLGQRPIGEVTAPELLSVLRRVEERGALDVTHRLRARCSQIFRYAIATGRATRDPATELRGAFATAATRSHAAITEPKKVGELLRASDGYTGTFPTRCALALAPLVFVRPGELRRAEWSEFDFQAREWRIPASKMKMRDPHLVPLSKQALAILIALKPLTGSGKYLFPSVRSRKRAMSENTLNGALRRLGYDNDTMTAHGFRAMAATRLNELGFASDVIERQLAHLERNKVRAAYNRALYIKERRTMMQAWADHLDSLRTSSPRPGSLE